ncbi:hypothetical protein Mar181_0996 [Marinomonas posidonica IVIA-Po-181]|uniref:DUF2513 domain-containing protein n=2 Tax=Marinomonas TaxID=28253 RepID=F6CTZ3_MARPP|nr:hypothetical protein Mar181_0996 [Marinomonas posidonica IVIA-Po-181]
MDRFNEVTAKIFAKLYEKFPIEIDIHIDEFTDESAADFYVAVDAGGFFLPDGDVELVQHTVRWLVREGYIHLECEQMSSFAGCTLTSKGLQTLNKIPQSLDRSYGEKLIEAIKDQGTDTMKSLAKQVLEYGTSLVF